MTNPAEPGAVAAFLAQKRVAVVGVGHQRENTGTFLMGKFQAAGYQVFGVNRHGGTSGGTPLHARVGDIPGGVTAVVVVTHPSGALDVVKDCHAAGVQHVWMHDNTLMPGSASAEAITYAREHGMHVIPRGCPAMHLQPDLAHRCMHRLLRATGRLGA